MRGPWKVFCCVWWPTEHNPLAQPSQTAKKRRHRRRDKNDQKRAPQKRGNKNERSQAPCTSTRCHMQASCSSSRCHVQVTRKGSSVETSASYDQDFEVSAYAGYDFVDTAASIVFEVCRQGSKPAGLSRAVLSPQAEATTGRA